METESNYGLHRRISPLTEDAPIETAESLAKDMPSAHVVL